MNKPINYGTLDALHFDNTFVRELPADPETTNSRRQVYGACYSLVRPTHVHQPKLVSYSPEVANLLGISETTCGSEEFVQAFSGNICSSAMTPYAMCYGGHQFGNWAGQLGDGRAINLGEVINAQNQRWVLQLKGAGPTPYSRTADGLAVLRSSVREFLCSEAMHHLGVPTTRALSLITTGELVERDMFYDGHPKDEPGAIVCRVAPSFIRFGNFEIFASREENDLLRKFINYTIRIDFPHLGDPDENVYLQWFTEVCKRTAEMIIHWMRVGFVHGVMNTDNMSILGLTIDYGPYGWLEDYNPGWTPNTTDAAGRRYCYGNQPHIAQWNLIQLANAIYPIIKNEEGLKEALDQYRYTFQKGWTHTMAQKLGFLKFEEEPDEEIINGLLDILTNVETDMTLFFRALAEIDSRTDDTTENASAHFENAYYKPEQLTHDYRQLLSSWLGKYRQRLQKDNVPFGQKKAQMNSVNPKYILRNYLAQIAIDKAEAGDNSEIRQLLDVLRHPYAEQPGKEKYAAKRPEWAHNRPGCSMLSCSS